MTAGSTSFGVYFMANDAVADWIDTFLYSVRSHNPNLPIIHIPFDDNWDRIKPLLRKYGCDRIGLPMGEYDAIGHAYFPDNPLAMHDYRRFASFHGPLERFLFVDIDTLVTADLAPVADAVFNSDYDVCHYRYGHMLRTFVDPRLMDFMAAAYPEYGRKGFNVALIISRRNAVPMDLLRHHRRRADTLRPMFGPAWCQGSVNYCEATAGLRAVRLPQLMPELSVNWHVAVDIAWDEAGKSYVAGPNTEAAESEDAHGPGGVVPGRKFVIIDWGGYKRPVPTIPHYRIWERYAQGAARYR